MSKELDRCFLETAVHINEIARLREIVSESAREFDAQAEKRKEFKELESLAKQRPDDVEKVFADFYPGPVDQEMLKLMLKEKSPLLLNFLNSREFFQG